MPFKTILTVIGDGASDRDLDIGVALCREANAHLSVLVVALAAPPPVGAYAAVVSDAWMQEREAEMARLNRRVETVEAKLGSEGISCDVECEFVEMAWTDAMVGRRARYSDITLFGPELLAGGDLRDYALSGAMFESGRPLLLAPTLPSLSPRRVMVAWDSSPEASRAAHEAVEILARADEVRIVMVDPQAGDLAQGDEPGADVAAWLARHGAKVTVDRLASGGNSVARVLRQHSIDMGADLIVMGAYGHSRMRQRIFGGVTKSMTGEPHLPVFLAR